jgi:four helix bundle protein
MKERRQVTKLKMLREESPGYGGDAHSNRYEALEMRCEDFARSVRAFFKKLSMTVANQEDGRQLIRSSGSVGANYIEANEALGKKDLLFHVKISRKEAKESVYWLRLLDCGNINAIELERQRLVAEARELMKIFGSIYRRSL